MTRETEHLRDEIALVAAADRLVAHSDDPDAFAAFVRETRDYDPAMLEAQYRAGVLTGFRAPDGMPPTRVDCCPLCGCFKSGDIDEPNPHADWCDDSTCLCHADAVRLALLDRTDDEPLPFEQGGDAMDWADGNEQFGEGL